MSAWGVIVYPRSWDVRKQLIICRGGRRLMVIVIRIARHRPTRVWSSL